MTPLGGRKGWQVAAPGGVPVILAPSWLVLFALVIAAFGPRVRDELPALGPVGAYALAAGYGVALLVSVLVHEAAHAVAARSVGARVGRVVVDLFGGHTVYDATDLTPATTAVVAAAGPIGNAVLAVAGFAALRHVDGVVFLMVMAVVATNVALAVFNLLPAHPLDGGALLAAAVWGLTGRRGSGLVVSGWAGRALVVVVMLVTIGRPLLAGEHPPVLMLLWVAAVGAMMWQAAGRAVQDGRRAHAPSG